jgi:hypothetical protein
MSALTDYRTDRFKQRQLALVVTPSEYNKFAEYCWALRIGLDSSYIPDPIRDGRACLFYRLRSGIVSWHDPDDLNVPDDMPAARIPFALLEYAPSTSAYTDIIRLSAEIQMRLQSIQNDVNFVNNAVEKLQELASLA